MEQVYDYTLTDGEIFENVFKADEMLVNHVVIPPGKIFPAHPTDAQVSILIIRGSLWVSVHGGAANCYGPGKLVRIGKGLESSLSNQSEALTELFVIKTDL